MPVTAAITTAARAAARVPPSHLRTRRGVHRPLRVGRGPGLERRLRLRPSLDMAISRHGSDSLVPPETDYLRISRNRAALVVLCWLAATTGQRAGRGSADAGRAAATAIGRRPPASSATCL